MLHKAPPNKPEKTKPRKPKQMVFAICLTTLQDSKHFVDMPLKESPEIVLEEFAKLEKKSDKETEKPLSLPDTGAVLVSGRRRSIGGVVPMVLFLRCLGASSCEKRLWFPDVSWNVLKALMLESW